MTAAAAASTAYPSTQYLQSGHQTRCKATLTLATTYLGRPGLLRMVGAGDKDHIITRVIPGMDPLQEFDEDDPTDVITIDHETDESDANDLSEVSMTLADAMTKEELQGLLANVTASQQKAAEAIDTLHFGRSSRRDDDRPSEPGSSYRGH